MWSLICLCNCFENQSGADCNHTRNIWCKKDCGDSFWLPGIFWPRIDWSAGNLMLQSLVIFSWFILKLSRTCVVHPNDPSLYWVFIHSCQGKWSRIFIFLVEACWEFHEEDLELVLLWTVWRWLIYLIYYSTNWWFWHDKRCNICLISVSWYTHYWFQERGINMLFVLGGNGTHAGANAVHNEVSNLLALYQLII